MEKLKLPNVTLLGIDCVNIERLQNTLDVSSKDIEFGAVKLRSNGNLSSLFSQNLCCDLPDSFFAFPAVRAQKILEAAPIAVQ